MRKLFIFIGLLLTLSVSSQQLTVGIAGSQSVVVEESEYVTNIVPEASSIFNTDGTAYWADTGGTIAWNEAGQYMSYTASSAWQTVLRNIAETGKTYDISIKIKSASYTGVVYVGCGGTKPATANITSSWQTFTITDAQDSDNNFYITMPATGQIDIDNIVVIEQ